MVENGRWRRGTRTSKGQCRFSGCRVLIAPHAPAAWPKTRREFLIAKPTARNPENLRQTFWANPWTMTTMTGRIGEADGSRGFAAHALAARHCRHRFQRFAQNRVDEGFRVSGPSFRDQESSASFGHAAGACGAMRHDSRKPAWPLTLRCRRPPAAHFRPFAGFVFLAVEYGPHNGQAHGRFLRPAFGPTGMSPPTNFVIVAA